MTTPGTNVLFDYAKKREEMLMTLRVIEASDSNLAGVLQTDAGTNARRCKCAFCKAEIEKGAGHPFNFWRGVRYLCDSCFPPFVDRTMENILSLELELDQQKAE